VEEGSELGSGGTGLLALEDISAAPDRGELRGTDAVQVPAGNAAADTAVVRVLADTAAAPEPAGTRVGDTVLLGQEGRGDAGTVAVPEPVGSVPQDTEAAL
jgi:hypothetical protein